MKFDSYKLQDVCDFIDYRGKTPTKTKSGVPLVTAKIIKNGVIMAPQEFIAEENYDEWMRRGIPQKGDIVFTTEAPLGEVAEIKTDDKLAFAQRVIIMEPKKEYLNNHYFLYALQDKKLKNCIATRASGTTVIGIKSAELKKIIIDLPSIQIQEKIADILYLLDEKIAINVAVNDNLQEQAFALFDQLMLDAGDSKCLVTEIAYINPKRPLKKNQMARCIDMSQLSTTGSFPSGWEMKSFNGGMRFTNGDTILARITPCLENGKTAYINFLDDKEIAFGSTEYIVLAPKEGVPPEYLYCLARYPAFVDYAVKNMNGSSGRQRVSADTIGQFVINCPNEDDLMDFGNIASTLFMKMKSNSLENLRMASLRDALLPKLMSGEIDVSNIEF